MPDDEFVLEYQKFNELVAEIEATNADSNEQLPPAYQKRIRELKFYNRILYVDEAYETTEKTRRTKRTVAHGALVRQHGHLHTNFLS